MQLPRRLRFVLYSVVIITTILGVVLDSLTVFLIGYGIAALLNSLWWVNVYQEKRNVS